MDPADDLASCLRSWRDRLTPLEVGLPTGRQRRAPGLRREELAQLAGLSVDYLSRLEQGRASNPSTSVLAPLARALRLTEPERAHLYRLAGQREPGPGRINPHLTPGVQRVLDRLADVPVMVLSPAWDVVARNPLAVALMGELEGDGPRDENLIWRLFTGRHLPFRHSAEELAQVKAEAVADLHDALGRYPADAALRALIAALQAASDEFARLWDQRPVAPRSTGCKDIDHPQVGSISLDCDHFHVPGSDVRLVVYTARPGSKDADALALLATIGLQQFAG